MNDQVSLNRDGISVLFNDAQRDVSGLLESFVVSLEATGLSASVRVDYPSYGPSLVRFFSDLADHWRGWEGEITWHSLEGELDLAAVSDVLGYITITVRVHPPTYPVSWTAGASVLVEAGQLERLHRQFVSFCGYEAVAHKPGA